MALGLLAHRLIGRPVLDKSFFKAKSSRTRQEVYDRSEKVLYTIKGQLASILTDHVSV
jgi:hypothetical protein